MTLRSLGWLVCLKRLTVEFKETGSEKRRCYTVSVFKASGAQRDKNRESL